MINNVKNKLILITGATSGIGKAIAYRFAREGAKVIGIARTEKRLEELKEEFAWKALTIDTYPCNVSKANSVRSLINEIINKHKKIDILVNNAGIGHKSPVEEMTEERFDEMIDINIKGVFLMTKYVLPHMKKEKDGYIINISSGAGKNGIANMSGYCATKFALTGFTESVALEAKPHDVKVSLVCPGSTSTEFHGKMGSFLDRETGESMIQPEDIADTIHHMVIQPKRYWVFEVVTRGFLMGRK